MGFFQGNAIIVGKFFASANGANAVNDDAILGWVAIIAFNHQGLAVWCATVIDPARNVATDVCVNEIFFVEREQERVSTLHIAAVSAICLIVG